MLTHSRKYGLFGLVLLSLLTACGGDGGSASTAVVDAPGETAACAPALEPIELTGEVLPEDEKTYELFPFQVSPDTGRVEVAYTWTDKGSLPSTPITQTVLDLGLWDADGYRSPEGFRGWSGSRQGRLDQMQAPVFVEADAAERGYMPGPIEPGVWHAELGYAAVGPQGADWSLQIQCKAAGGGNPENDPVDPAHVANPAAGWYHGDFHMHAYHSHPEAPDWAGFIEQSRAANLDFLMITEYVTGAHWRTLGTVQRANPDLLVWPGREIITYFGHATTFGETPGVLEYRHGFEDVSLGDIQARSKAAGALFGIAHPTIFPGPLFENFCRGCEFRLDGAIDFEQVDTIEVVTGPIRATSGDLGLPDLPAQIQNPFTLTAIDYWEDKLNRGFKITAVSGSDSKGVDAPAERQRKGYGSSATAVFADALSRPDLRAAIRAGHAYVRTLGVERSPALAFTVTTADGQTGIFGDTVFADSATLETTVTGGQGQLLTYVRDGTPFLIVPILSDPFTHSLDVARRSGSGPLGTFYRVETADLQSLTTIGNPVFLRAPAAAPGNR